MESAQTICDGLIEPNAEAVDQAGRVPLDNLRELADAGLVAITTPGEFGGVPTSEAFRQEFIERLCAACGSTFFTLTQHLGSCGQFASSANPLLRERYLREMAAGRHWVGVGFGHLRRPTPMLRATPTRGGWELTGVAPWVTGWPILSGVIFGAHLPDGRHLFVYTEAVESDALRSSPPLPLAAMNATETTEVHLERLFVPKENFLRYSSAEEMARGDEANIAAMVAPMLGVARGSLKTLRTIAARRPLPVIGETADALEREIDACRAECRRWATSERSAPEYHAGALAARTGAIELGVRAALMTVAAASGAATALSHPAQRRLREAMFYTVFQQTADILGATLVRLRRP